MYKEHSTFKPPPDDAILWRYMDFTKFVSLLDKRSLFFARADKLGDPFEGSFSRANKELRSILYAGKIPQASLLGWRHFRQQSRRFTLISCWHESLHESEAMWRLYSREINGIAIKTDFDSFRRGLISSEDIFVGKVSYIDYESEFIPESNTFAPYLYKRKGFNHECEVRAMTQDIPTNDGKVDLSKDICTIGKYYEVDLSLLIQEVIVAPYAPEWFLDLIKSVATRYNLDAPVVKSALADAPTWG